jgi:hypothetical protein
MPPTAGLQLILANEFKSMEINSVLAPRFAEAQAASQPAWPPPITMTSNSSILQHIFPQLEVKILL